MATSRAPTSTTTVSLSMDESSSDDPTAASSNNVRFPIDHYAKQYRINKNAKNRRKASHSHQHNNQCKTGKCGVDYKATNTISNAQKQEINQIISIRRWGKFFTVFLPSLYGVYAYYVFFYIIPNLPFLVIFEDNRDPQQLITFRILFGTFSIILTTIWYWAYLKAKYSHPGPIPKAWKEWNGNPMTRPSDPIYAVNNMVHGATVIISKNTRLYCTKCKVFRPYRTGHCRRCNVCVTRLDHHCTFLNNCIGSNNQRYFVQFLIYTAIAFILYLCCTPFSKLNVIYNIFDGTQWNATIFVIYTLLPILAIVGLSVIIYIILAQYQSIVKNRTFTEIKFHNDMRLAQRDGDSARVDNNKASCCTLMKEGFKRGWNKRKRTVKDEDEEERKGLLKNDSQILHSNVMEQKGESEEVNIDDKLGLKQYDLGSRWKNIESVFGSSIIHWFIPLDWNEDELYKMMLTKSFSLDLLPLFLLKDKRIKQKSVIVNYAC